jgi:hypothetical protein
VIEFGIMETLTRLLGSASKVKLIKLFIFNPHTAFDIDALSEKTKESQSKIRQELGNLDKMKLIKRRVFYKNVEKKRQGQKSTIRSKLRGWILNENFDLLVPLHTFLVNSNHLSPKDVSKKLSKSGNIKLVIVAGVFIHDPESRVDLLIVGDHLKKSSIENTIGSIESEMGKELRYAVFETTDFQYRLGMYDKLIRDVLDYPHEKIINKLAI